MRLASPDGTSLIKNLEYRVLVSWVQDFHCPARLCDSLVAEPESFSA